MTSKAVSDLLEKTREARHNGGVVAYLDRPQNKAALKELREYVKACRGAGLVPSGAVIMPHLKKHFGLKLAESALRLRLRQELAALED